ncbi:MAG: metal ABC transporter permease [Chlamydiae bacterium]|nr:metal ABC transporter permease [Chlamydiota bacterium]
MMLGLHLNPYKNCDFFEFFSVLSTRVLGLITGQIGLADLVSDEIQLLVLLGLCFSSAFLGVFLVLKRMTMMANAICHTILLGIVLAVLVLSPFFNFQASSNSILSMKILLMSSLCTALLTTFLMEFFKQTVKVQEDASIGIVFTFLFAVGVVLVTLFTKNIHIGTEAIMGNIDALDVDDLQIVLFVSLMNFSFFTVFYKRFTSVTFDPLFSSSIGISVSFYNYMIMVLTSATCIAAFRAVGVLLVLMFFVAPPLMSRMLTNNLRSIICLSFILPAIGSFITISLSRHFLTVYQVPISTSGLLVTVFFVMYLLLLLLSPKNGLFTNFLAKSLPIKVID